MRFRSPSCWSPIGRAWALPSALYEVMRCAPSTRYFTDEPVPRELLHRVLDNARYAPSGGNRQGWRGIVVTDRDTRRRLRELYEPPWGAYMIQTGGRAALAAGEAGGGCCALPTISPTASTRSPSTWSPASSSTRWRSSTTAWSAPASSAAPRSIRSCRTSCLGCGQIGRAHV